MKTVNKMMIGFVALSFLAGMGAQANKISTGMYVNSGLYATAQDSDSIRKAQQEDAVLPQSVVDEVVWVVGDEPILKSDIEMTRLQYESMGMSMPGNASCLIPEQLAVQKLFLHQAAIDSIEVTESDIKQRVDAQISDWIQSVGSREKLEEYRKKTITQIRQDMHDDVQNMLLTQKMQQKISEEVKVSPSQVRNYYRTLPEDSIPFVPTEVEVEIITHSPKIPVEEVNRVKNELRSYTDRINKGEISFGTLARLYSEDPGSARVGGELDYTPRAQFDPAFGAVAFNLTDPKKISKIVESEFGFHIIQLIDRRGDKVKCRHILLKPVVPQEEIDKAISQLDSVGNEMRAGKYTFEEAVPYLSDDKDTRNNRGLYFVAEDGITPISKLPMKDLPSEMAHIVDTLKVGQISQAFQMVNKRGKTITAMVKLKSRTEGHRAKITEDFQVLRDMVLAKEKEKAIHEWIENKIKHTYIKMGDDYKNCKFEYQGWIK